MALFFGGAQHASADAPCSGGDKAFARPIAEAMQPYASRYNKPAELQLITEPGDTGPLMAITLRRVVDKQEVFAVTVKFKDLMEVQLGTLPPGEGTGFTLKTTAGGTGYQEQCTYGFRLVNNAFEYRTLSAFAISPGETTEWTRLAQSSASSAASTVPPLTESKVEALAKETWSNLPLNIAKQPFTETISYLCAQIALTVLKALPDDLSRAWSAKMSTQAFSALLAKRIEFESSQIIPASGLSAMDFAIGVVADTMGIAAVQAWGEDSTEAQLVRQLLKQIVPSLQLSTNRYPQFLFSEVRILAENSLEIASSGLSLYFENRAAKKSAEDLQKMVASARKKRLAGLPPAIVDWPGVKATLKPPVLPFVQTDRCLLYKCGEDWTSDQPKPIFTDTDPASPQLGLTKAGVRYEPVDARWITQHPDILVVRQRWAAEENRAHWYETRDMIYLYAQWGAEGCRTIWTRGYLYFDNPPREAAKCIMIEPDATHAEPAAQGSFELWVKLKLPDGRMGWVLDRQRKD
jgi:hypothetical protein